MSTLKPESRWTASLAQTCAIIAAVAAAVWVMRGEFEAMRNAHTQGQAEANKRLSSIETFIKSNAVTITHAERYAAAFRWENRGQGVIVPDIMLYRDIPDNRLQ